MARQASRLGAAATTVHATPVRGVHTTWQLGPVLRTIRSMEASRARAIAEQHLAGIREDDGTPLLLHVRRVAERTPPEARAVAWLHEVLRATSVSEQQLLAQGLSSEELRALRLLSQPNPWRSEAVRWAHLQLIVHAAGNSGHLARVVQAADMEDRRLHPRVEALSPCTRRVARRG